MMLDFLSPEHRDLILKKAAQSISFRNAPSLSIWQSISKAQDLTEGERKHLINVFIRKGSYKTHIALCADLENPAAYLKKRQIKQLVKTVCSIRSPFERADALGDMGRALAPLDDVQRNMIFDAAISLPTEGRMLDAFHGLADGMRHLNDAQYEQMIECVMAMTPVVRKTALSCVAKHMNQLNPVRRNHLFCAVDQIQDPFERRFALSALSAADHSLLSSAQRDEIFDAVMQLKDTEALQHFCPSLGLLDPTRRTALFDVAMSLRQHDIDRSALMDGLAGQIAHLTPDQAHALALNALEDRFVSLGVLLRATSSASGDQRERVDRTKIIETLLNGDHPGWSLHDSIRNLTEVVDMLNDEQCRQFVNKALNLHRTTKARALAAAGQILHRLPEELRETMINAAEDLPLEDRVKVVVGLSPYMAHLSPQQCERLLRMAPHAYSDRPFNDENIHALHSLVTATWPWSARWEEAPAAAA